MIVGKLLEKAKNEIRPLNSIITKLDLLKLDLTRIENDLKLVRDNVSETRTKLHICEQNKQKLMDTIKSEEKMIETERLLSEHRAWLEKYFYVGIENIERHVMESLRRHFNNQFQRWFEILVEDPALRVKVDENFTAQITRESFDQDYLQLSGGERTSIALAYRLALNFIVQQVSAGGSSNLLILDEPTDGFSKQQIYKLRDVFHELKCPQIIMVSHEREIEGFADKIINIQNKNGVSTINLN